MYSPSSLDNRMAPEPLTPREAEVLQLGRAYQRVAAEPPSCAWLGRRLSITRAAAHRHVQSLRDKNYWPPFEG